MLKLKLLLPFLCILSVLPTCSTSAAEYHKSFLLLNDDTILPGEFITFTEGFLYFKQEDKILKISPAYFKGIFNTYNDADKAKTLLNNLPDPQEKKRKRYLSNTYNEAEIILSSIAAEKEIEEIMNEVRLEFTEPVKMLDTKVYKKLALLSAVSAHYNLSQKLPDLIEECVNKESFKDLPEETQNEIESRKETLYYLIEHPYIKK